MGGGGRGMGDFYFKYVLLCCCFHVSPKFNIQHDRVLKKVILGLGRHPLRLCGGGGGLQAKYLLLCCCIRDSLYMICIMTMF